MDAKGTTFPRANYGFRVYILPYICKIKNYVFEVSSFTTLNDIILAYYSAQEALFVM
jgi:hypothetical protein